MSKVNLPVIKKTTIFDRIKNVFNKISGNYEYDKPFINDTLPNDEKINTIKMMEIIKAEMKLRNVIRSNNRLFTEDLQGISKLEAEKILLWVVQNARETLFKCDKEENDVDQSLQGLCGLGQALTAIPLMKMGLKPNINQTNKITDNEKTSPHGFVTVTMPIIENEKFEDKLYLIDTTFRQFFQTKDIYTKEEPVKDKQFGKVIPTEGYILSRMRHGTELANELLKMGYIELTLENAKLYCDAFAKTKLKTYNRPPTSIEVETCTLGQEYIRKLSDKEIQTDLEYTEDEFNTLGYNIKTPLQQNQDKLNEEKLEELENTVVTYKKKEEQSIR